MVSAMTANKLQPDDRVHHWFAGTGTVVWASRSRVFVKWDKGSNGIALPAHCRLQSRRRQPTKVSP